MPKKPTAFTQKAVSDLTTLIAKLKPQEPLPPLRTLARRLEVHASTVCRLLKDFADEGKAWRSPSGRYFAATERGAGLRGLSLCFIGREMHHWSQLYQELLEGISEVCSANEGNLVLVSSPRLLSQSSPAEVRSILPPRNQGAEIQRLIERLPQGLAGLVLDHLWDENALALASLPRMETRALLLPPTGKLGCASPNYDQGAELSLAHAQHCGYTEFVVVRPFTGDPSIDAIIKSFTTVASSWRLRIATGQDTEAIRTMIGGATRGKSRVCIICPEDNTALSIAHVLSQRNISPEKIGLISLQGTGAAGLPLTHIRYDYRRLGRATAATILHGRKPWIAPATFLPGKTTQRTAST